MKLRKYAIIFLIAILFNCFVPCCNTSVYGAINEEYADTSGTVDFDDIGSTSTLLNWTAEILFKIAEIGETLVSSIMKIFTGSYFYPWIDLVIFNSVSILDINFINPAPGSFFAYPDGSLSMAGKVIRNTYFTVLTIAISFLTLAIAIAAIRLAVTSMTSKKGEYVKFIQNLAMCLVLVFMMHYIIAFVFFLNEKLVEIASVFMTDVLTDEVSDVIEKLEEAEHVNDEKMVYNFLMENNDICFIKNIPFIGDIYQGVRDFVNRINQVLSVIWENFVSIFTNDDNTEGEITTDELETMYPSLDDFNKWFLRVDRFGNPKDTNYSDEDINRRVRVAAYLLKNKFYRLEFLDWASGTDANNIENAGLVGVVKNVAIFANDVFGIVDLGYKSVKTLFTSTALIVHGYEGASLEMKTNQQAAYDNLSQEGKDNYDGGRQNVDFSADYYADKILSFEGYNEYIKNASEQYNKYDRAGDKKMALIYKVDILYANAFMECVYDKDDKPQLDATAIVTGLGEYFKGQAHYVDVDNGGWAPDYINPTAAIIYVVMVVQSLIILFSYVKRLFYVIILALISPVAVVFDFLSSSL